jgi:hypothetical protein
MKLWDKFDKLIIYSVNSGQKYQNVGKIPYFFCKKRDIH